MSWTRQNVRIEFGFSGLGSGEKQQLTQCRMLASTYQHLSADATFIKQFVKNLYTNQ